MSAATEFAPAVIIPERARTCPPPQRLATVTTLHRPSERTSALPVRLTRRGALTVAVAVGLLCAGLIGLAWLSAPGSATGAGGTAKAPATVTVQAGDSLWTIATRVAPDRDPRAEVADLQQLNTLHGAGLVPGQVLRTR